MVSPNPNPKPTQDASCSPTCSDWSATEIADLPVTDPELPYRLSRFHRSQGWNEIPVSEDDFCQSFIDALCVAEDSEQLLNMCREIYYSVRQQTSDTLRDGLVYQFLVNLQGAEILSNVEPSAQACIGVGYSGYHFAIYLRPKELASKELAYKELVPKELA